MLYEFAVGDMGIQAASMSSREPAHVDLAGDGSGDQGGAAFLQQVDGSLGFGGEGIDLRICGSMKSTISNCSEWEER